MTDLYDLIGKDAFANTFKDLWEYKNLNRRLNMVGEKELENTVLEYTPNNGVVKTLFTERVYGSK